MHRAAEAVRAALGLPVHLGHDGVDRRALRDRVRVRPVGRRDHVTLLERGAYPRRDRLLADRDVEESGKLSRAESVLHLLLEAADDEHLAEQLAQPRVGEARCLARYAFDLRHGRHYADRPMKLVEQWGQIEARLPRGWEDVQLTLTPEEPRDLQRAAALLGPLNAGRIEGALSFVVRRAGSAAGPEAARRLFARLDEERIWS